jgi:hypothetical protein
MFVFNFFLQIIIRFHEVIEGSVAGGSTSADGRASCQKNSR